MESERNKFCKKCLKLIRKQEAEYIKQYRKNKRKVERESILKTGIDV